MQALFDINNLFTFNELNVSASSTNKCKSQVLTKWVILTNISKLQQSRSKVGIVQNKIALIPNKSQLSATLQRD